MKTREQLPHSLTGDTPFLEVFGQQFSLGNICLGIAALAGALESILLALDALDGSINVNSALGNMGVVAFMLVIGTAFILHQRISVYAPNSIDKRALQDLREGAPIVQVSKSVFTEHLRLFRLEFMFQQIYSCEQRERPLNGNWRYIPTINKEGRRFLVDRTAFSELGELEHANNRLWLVPCAAIEQQIAALYPYDDPSLIPRQLDSAALAESKESCTATESSRSFTDENSTFSITA